MPTNKEIAIIDQLQQVVDDRRDALEEALLKLQEANRRTLKFHEDDVVEVRWGKNDEWVEAIVRETDYASNGVGLYFVSIRGGADWKERFIFRSEYSIRARSQLSNRPTAPAQ